MNTYLELYQLLNALNFMKTLLSLNDQLSCMRPRFKSKVTSNLKFKT